MLMILLQIVDVVVFVVYSSQTHRSHTEHNLANRCIYSLRMASTSLYTSSMDLSATICLTFPSFSYISMIGMLSSRYVAKRLRMTS